jgi:iron complex outermembrane receptor protein
MRFVAEFFWRTHMKHPRFFRHSALARAAAQVCCASLAVCAFQAANAQDESPSLQRVEITGSSIKRIAAEGALPVTVMKAAEIKASGVNSLADLVARMSVSQGQTGESASVGGSTYGFSGVSIHGVGETRTLVLLNGKRLALFGGQTLTGFAAGFDLNALPMSAIDRVELLTDGASALYGADAIAGVVNFITKHNSTDGEVSYTMSQPDGGGAAESKFSATKGFGKLEDDGFNVMLTWSQDDRKQMYATDRKFAKTGVAFFEHEGKRYRMQQYSASPIPANVLNNNDELVNPTLLSTGACPAKTFRVTQPYNDGSGLVDDYCGFDFTAELEIQPERKRDSFMASVTARVAEQELYADVLLSKTSQVSRIAPVPGSISIPAGTALHDQYLLPLGITVDSTAFYRLYDMGKRTSSDTAEFSNFVLGSRGALVGWDYDASYSNSTSDVKGSISGYPGALAISALRKSGLLDPFVGPGQQSAAAQAKIAATAYNGYWDGGVSKLNVLALNGNKALTQMDAGPLMLGVGVNFNTEDFESKPSLFAQGKLADPVAGTLCNGTTLPCDQRFGDESATVPYSASRRSHGLFGELVIPVAKNFEVGTALRLDNYSDFGGANTAKANFRWTPAPNLMVRGSIGTGFHAPTVPQVNAVLQPYGVTTDKYPCSPELAAVAASKGAVCQPGKKQYDQLAGGNPTLEPEKSTQATLGIRFEPNNSMSFGADLWAVNMTNAFGQLTEQLVFDNPAKFAKSWGTKRDTGTGVNYLAFIADNQNLGNSYSTGLDLDFAFRTKTSMGLLSSDLKVTYMLREVSQLEKDGPYYSAVGDFSDLGTVTFRTQGRWTTSLKTGDWTNTLGVNFKSDYKDLLTTVDVLDANGNVTGTEDIRVQVPWTATLDWQTLWKPTKQLSLTLGILNLLDSAPPFVPSTGGTNRGQQFGYDDRYYDARGRIVYVTGTYNF